jgi:hypothetical protein
MSNFIEFYKSGVPFNHFVAVGLGVATAALVFHTRSSEEARREGAWLTVCDRALIACVGLGLVGVLFSAIEASAVLRSLPPDKVLEPALRILGLLVIPLLWSLLGALPLWIVSTALRFRVRAHPK